MNKIIALCGKPGSGKSYIAKKISKEYKYILFSIDEIMLKLFGEIDGRELFEIKNKLCIEMIFEISEKILKNSNGNIIYDFGFWTRTDRNNFKERFKNYKVIFAYINTNDNIRWERVEKRNKENNIDNYNFDRKTFDFLSSLFEDFHKDEEYILFDDINTLMRKIDGI